MSSPVRWRPGPWWIALAASVLFGIELGARVFANNDEARFPLLAQDILARGDWLWPQLNAAAYHNKPPLLAWLIALLSWPVGHVTQLTAVIPSAAAAVVTVVLVYRIARDLFGEDAGRFAALVAMTTQGLFFHAHLALPDVLMTCFMTVSVWALVRMEQNRPGRWWIGFYGFVAAAFWAKGPAGLLPLAVAIVLAWATRSSRRWSLRLAAGLSLVAGAIGLWLLLGALSDTRAVTDTLVIDQLGWYWPGAPGLATLIAPARSAFIALFPWVLLAPVAIVAAYRLRGAPPERESVRLALVWLGVVAVLVGLSSQQRLRYYVPLVPPMAVVVGRWLAGAALTRWRARVPWAFAASWVVVVLGFIGGYHWELTRHNTAGDYRDLAARLKPRVETAPLVAAWDVPELPLAFYLDRPVTRVGSERALRDILAREPQAIVVVAPANWARLDESEQKTVVVDVAARRRPRR
jgi:4-amino-4-deoxy-L-arabinose transferase-like glycosyltransferase